MLSHSISFGNDRSEQFIDDLNSLCKRHKIHCGEPQDLDHLTADLASNDNFRIDLFSLCTAISHMAETDLSPQQLLPLVARAFGGPEAPISDAADLPNDASSTFIAAYERWTRREPDSDPSPIDGDPASDPGPSRYYTAATRSASFLHEMRDDPSNLPADGATIRRRPIPANTPLESLTLNELRMYLEEIENRVRRIEPHLDRIIHETSPPEPSQVAEALALQSAHLIIPVDDSTVPPLAIVPTRTPVAASLHRLHIVNAVLACLLLLACTAAAIFVYRYMHQRPDTLADVLHRAPLPAVELPSDSQPSASTNTTATREPHATSPSPQPAHHPNDAEPATVEKPDKPAAASNPVAATSPHVNPPAPQAETTKTPPTAPETHGPSTPSPSNQPSTTASQDHPQPKPVPLAANPVTAKADPAPAKAEPKNPAPAVALSLVSAKSSPAPPPDVPTHAPTPHPDDSPVAVPSSTMLAYGISTPKPLYPTFMYSPVPRTVEVAANISKEGKVTNARALNGSGGEAAAAVRAVQYWRFKPFTLQGKPVDVVTTFKFVFTPHEP